LSGAVSKGVVPLGSSLCSAPAVLRTARQSAIDTAQRERHPLRRGSGHASRRRQKKAAPAHEPDEPWRMNSRQRKAPSRPAATPRPTSKPWRGRGGEPTQVGPSTVLRTGLVLLLPRFQPPGIGGVVHVPSEPAPRRPGLSGRTELASCDGPEHQCLEGGDVSDVQTPVGEGGRGLPLLPGEGWGEVMR
jgi:hypothetical protein